MRFQTPLSVCHFLIAEPSFSPAPLAFLATFLPIAPAPFITPFIASAVIEIVGAPPTITGAGWGNGNCILVGSTIASVFLGLSPRPGVGMPTILQSNPGNAL
ncbi:hypothetical protein VIAE108258_05985 [Vibrio aerogenes]